jgi:hypothetical protein
MVLESVVGALVSSLRTTAMTAQPLVQDLRKAL